MRQLLPCLLLAALGGCHLIFPFTPGAAPAPVDSDGAALDMTTNDVQPLSDGVKKDQPLVFDSGTPTWKPLVPKGLAPADTSSELKIWGLSATEIYIGVGSDVYLCSDTDLATTEIYCMKPGAIGGGMAAITSMGGASPEVFAVSDQGHVLSKTKSWGTQFHSTIDHFAGIFCRDKTACLLVGARDVGPASFQIVYDTSSGTLATPYTNQVAPKFNAIWSMGNTTAVACNGCTLFMKTPTLVWAKQTPGSCTHDLRGVWGNAENDIHAVGAGGTRLRWSGSQWLMDGTGGVDLNAIWGQGGTYFAVGAQGVVWIWQGGSWVQKVNLPVTTELTGVWGLSASHVYVVGKGNTVVRYH